MKKHLPPFVFGLLGFTAGFVVCYVWQDGQPEDRKSQDAAAIIEQLDGESDADPRERNRELRIIPVNTSDPDQLGAQALRVFAAQNVGRNITNLLSITPEPSRKHLIVLAPLSLMAQVSDLVAALDQPDDQAARELMQLASVARPDARPKLEWRQPLIQPMLPPRVVPESPKRIVVITNSP